MTIEFLVTSIVIILLPGTGVLYTLATGLSRGLKSSILAAFGCTLGIVPHIFASVVGLAALLHTSAVAFQIVKYLGVAYLFYMAWRTLKEKGALEISGEQTEADALKTIASGMTLNVLNPKLSLFFLAFLPQFVPANATNSTLTMLGLAAIFMALTFIVFVGYGAFAATTRTYVISRPRVVDWLRRAFAGVFGLLGAKLALSDN
jgi:threonine/homoserine/homoserine lactone efflux protein